MWKSRHPALELKLVCNLKDFLPITILSNLDELFFMRNLKTQKIIDFFEAILNCDFNSSMKLSSSIFCR